MASAILRSAHHELPTELVLGIVDHLSDDKRTLCMLARTSRVLQHLAEEHIYKTIPLTTVLDLRDIIQAFSCRRERVRAVQTLKLQYHYNIQQLEDSVDMRKMFNECVAHMVNLREWHIESPYDNCHWEDAIGPEEWVKSDMEKFRAALELACTRGPVETQHIQAERALGNVVDRTVGLALLERLTIHSHGTTTDFWDLDGFECLFRHPTLRHLHISCVCFIDELPTLQSHNGKTPLTTLIFDECEISPVSLRDILRLPARLKHLTLGENVWNTRRSKRIRPRLTKDAGAALEALSPVAHSLESLTHFDPTWKLNRDSYKATRMRPIGNGMREFHALKSIECELTSFLHQAIIMNHEIAPPNLETLRLRRHYYVSVDFFDVPPEVETYLALPSLSTLELVQSSHCWLELSMPEYICDEQRVRARHAYAYKLYKAGINLKLFIEMHRDDQIIPPYLHGEARPISDCLYDASEVGFRRHVSPPKLSRHRMAFATEEMIEDYMHERMIEEHCTKLKDPPETDQLGDGDISLLTDQTHRQLQTLKDCFIKHRRLRRAESILEFVDDDEEEDEDGEFDLEMDDWEDEEYDVETDEDDNEVIFHEQNGELYIEVYESEPEEEDDAEQGAMEAELD